MKPILRSSLLALGLVTVAALPAHAVTTFSERFSAATLNASRWSLSNEGGRLMPANGKLNYSVSAATGDDTDSHIVLRGIQPKYNESWEVIVDAANSTHLKDWTWIGVAVLNASDMGDFVGLEIAGGPYQQTEIFSDCATDDVEGADVEKATSFTKASLRVTFSHVTKVITLSYRTSPTAPWTKHSTFSTNNNASVKRRGNWRMNNTTGKFAIALYAGGESVKIPTGPMSLDNFVIRNLVGSALASRNLSSDFMKAFGSR